LRRRREIGDFKWDVKSLIESGSIKPENVAYENMTEAPTTEIPMADRIKLLQDSQNPYFGVCTNESKIITDPKRIYGYYERQIVVQNPVKNVTIEGKTWLQHGDMSYLIIKFDGTAPFKYCPLILHNGSLVNEQQCSDWKETNDKQIYFSHFFTKQSDSYSVILLVKNEVSLSRTTVAIKFYEGL